MILRTFFKAHDPTQLNRQGNDVGTQYRSIILYHTQNQYLEAKDLMDELNKTTFKNEMTTQLIKYKTFYPAEKKHINYYERNSEESYCKFVVRPKVKKVKEFIKKNDL